MYRFAIDMGEENSYSPAAPKGVFVARGSLKTGQLAVSNWQLASVRYLVLGIWYLVKRLRPSA